MAKVKQSMKYTVEQIKDQIINDDRVFHRAIIVLYEKQTEDERNAEQTLHHNKVGFNGVDANFMSYCARWVLDGKQLTGKFKERARQMILKYAKQLTAIANAKAALKVQTN